MKKKIEIEICYYKDDTGNKVYDYEHMSMEWNESNQYDKNHPNYLQPLKK
jgi:hypothetical protein